MRGGHYFKYPLGFPPRKLQPIAKAAGGRGGVAKRHEYKSAGVGLLLACLLSTNIHVSGSRGRGHQGFPRVMDQEKRKALAIPRASSHTTASHVLERERAS